MTHRYSICGLFLAVVGWHAMAASSPCLVPASEGTATADPRAAQQAFEAASKLQQAGQEQEAFLALAANRHP